MTVRRSAIDEQPVEEEMLEIEDQAEAYIRDLLVASGKEVIGTCMEIIGIYVHSSMDRASQSLDNIVARDLKTTPWAGLVDEDVNALGKRWNARLVILFKELNEDMFS
ncbi:hypothetical protein HAX54_045642 [Datura stramonium]|uniref:Uncharacterized protein n=1 Tax=Datura stramonium TaxID=4076 RepID=A0ABS8RPX4_DATST|nr:hypothetical protein [Datura stramonium]